MPGVKRALVLESIVFVAFLHDDFAGGQTQKSYTLDSFEEQCRLEITDCQIYVGSAWSMVIAGQSCPLHP